MSLIDSQCKVCKRADVRHINQQHIIEGISMEEIAVDTGIKTAWIHNHFYKEHHITLMKADYYKKSVLSISLLSMKQNLVQLQGLLQSKMNDPDTQVSHVTTLSKEVRAVAHDIKKYEKEYGQESEADDESLEELVTFLLSFIMTKLTPKDQEDLTVLLEARGMKALLPEATT